MKYIIAKMPDGSRYKIPLEVIKDLYKRNYTKEFREEIGEISDDAIAFRAHRFTNWLDIENHAIRLPGDSPDMDSLWRSAEKKILET